MVPPGSATRRPRLLVLVALLLVGCPRSQRRIEESFDAALSRADAAWEARGRDGFAPVDAALGDAEALAPGHPEVAWRRTRLYVSRGLASDEPAAAMRYYSSARSTALDCLFGSSQYRPGEVGQALERALTRYGQARRGCVEWGTLGWARWYGAFDPVGAAVDLPRLDQLLDWSAANPMGNPGPHAGIRAWSEGLVYALRPESSGRDLTRARDALLAAIDARPGDWAIRVDLVDLVAEPLGETELAGRQVRRIQSSVPATPENRRAQARFLEHVGGKP